MPNLDLYQMAKQAGVVHWKCGHSSTALCAGEVDDEKDCPLCREQKKGEEEEEVPKKTPAARKVIDSIKDVGTTAIGAGAGVATALKSIATPVPLQTLDPKKY